MFLILFAYFWLLGVGWGLDAPAQPSATILWPHVTCLSMVPNHSSLIFYIFCILHFNKAGYKATLDMHKWAGAAMEKVSELKTLRNAKKNLMGTNQRTEKAGWRVAWHYMIKSLKWIKPRFEANNNRFLVIKFCAICTIVQTNRLIPRH